jgi:hypothetical protein
MRTVGLEGEELAALVHAVDARVAFPREGALDAHRSVGHRHRRARGLARLPAVRQALAVERIAPLDLLQVLLKTRDLLARPHAPGIVLGQLAAALVDARDLDQRLLGLPSR